MALLAVSSGIGFGSTERGFSRLTMIYAILKGYPFMQLPLAAGPASLQMILIDIHDYFAERAPAATGATLAPMGDD